MYSTACWWPFFFTVCSSRFLTIVAIMMYNLNVIFFYSYVLSFSLGAGPVPALLLPEIFASRIRAKAVALSLGMHWVSLILILSKSYFFFFNHLDFLHIGKCQKYVIFSPWSAVKVFLFCRTFAKKERDFLGGYQSTWRACLDVRVTYTAFLISLVCLKGPFVRWLLMKRKAQTA